MTRRSASEGSLTLMDILKTARLNSYKCILLGKRFVILSFFLSICINIILAVLLAKKSTEQSSGCYSTSSLCALTCPEDWIAYRKKCYYFSTEKKNWTNSQDFCAQYNASLITFSGSQKKTEDFVLRHKRKGNFWTGLKRERGQPWKVTNGEKSMLTVLGDEECAFINNEDTFRSLSCRIELYWICSKHL